MPWRGSWQRSLNPLSGPKHWPRLNCLARHASLVCARPPVSLPPPSPYLRPGWGVRRKNFSDTHLPHVFFCGSYRAPAGTSGVVSYYFTGSSAPGFICRCRGNHSSSCRPPSPPPLVARSSPTPPLRDPRPPPPSRRAERRVARRCPLPRRRRWRRRGSTPPCSRRGRGRPGKLPLRLRSPSSARSDITEHLRSSSHYGAGAP